MATRGKFLTVVFVACTLYVSCQGAAIVADPIAECKGENCTSSTRNASNNVNDDSESGGDGELHTRQQDDGKTDAQLKRQMQFDMQKLQQQIRVASQDDAGNTFLTELSTKTQRITSTLYSSDDSKLQVAVNDLKQIDRDEAAKLKSANALGTKHYGQSLETLASLIGTFSTHGQKLFEGIKNKKPLEVFSSTVGITSGLLSVIPHPAAEFGVMLLDVVSTFISLGTPKKPKTDPYKAIRDKIKAMVVEMKAEFDMYMFARSAGATDVVMHMFRLQVKKQGRYTRRQWDELVEGNNMIARPDMAIQDLAMLSSRMAYLVKENKVTSYRKSRIIYQLYHAYAGLAGIRDMVLTKLTTLMPNNDADEKYLIEMYMTQLNFDRMDAFNVLKILHTPDDITIASVNFYYPIGLDPLSEAISNYLSTLTYVTEDGEGDLMPMADDAHIPSGDYYIQVSEGTNDYFGPNGPNTQIYYSSHTESRESGGVLISVPVVDHDIKASSLLNRIIEYSDPPPPIFKIEYKNSPTDPSHVITSSGQTVRFVKTSTNKLYTADTIWVYTGDQAKSNQARGVGVVDTDNHKIIRVGHQDGSPVVVIGARDGTRWWTKDGAHLQTKALETDADGRVAYRQKFKLVTPYGYQTGLGDKRTTTEDVCPGEQGVCKREDGSSLQYQCFSANTKGECLKSCLENESKACWWRSTVHYGKCCYENGQGPNIQSVATQNPGDVCWEISRCKVIPGTQIIPGPEIGTSTEGDWKPWTYCDQYYTTERITGFEIRVEPKVTDDDSGVNGIRIKCSSNSIKQAVLGVYGTWRGLQTCSSGNIIGFSVRSYKTDTDNFGMVNIRAECSNGGTGTGVLHGGGLDYGDYTHFKRCPPPTQLCGLRALYEEYQGNDDDSAVNKIQLACCLNERLQDIN